MEFFIYLLKVNVALVLFYGFYRLFFQQDTLFQWKRAVLLVTLAVAALYPFVDITWHLMGGWQLPQTMNKKQTANRSLLKYALIVPLIAALVFFNSTLKIQAETVNEPVVQDSLVKKTKKPVDKDTIYAHVEEIFTHVEEMPKFPGGDEELSKWLMKNVIYPEEAAKERIQGGVTVGFILGNS
jgi:hypothetical protein